MRLFYLTKKWRFFLLLWETKQMLIPTNFKVFFLLKSHEKPLSLVGRHDGIPVFEKQLAPSFLFFSGWVFHPLCVPVVYWKALSQTIHLRMKSHWKRSSQRWKSHNYITEQLLEHQALHFLTICLCSSTNASDDWKERYETGNWWPAQALSHCTSGGGQLRSVLTHISVMKTKRRLIKETFHVLGGKGYDPEKADYSGFEAWLQCYYVDGMKTLRDHNGRTVWFKVSWSCRF